jgi:hypothetical protein
VGKVWTQTPQVGQNLASLVYLDNKNILQDGEYFIQKDQFISFETFDLQPYSTVVLTGSARGLSGFHKEYHTNQDGNVKDFLFFPKVKREMRCVLKIVTQSGVERKIVFFLKPA